RTTIQFLGAEFALGQVIPPIAESTFGVLHDVAFVDKSDAFTLLGDRILNGGTDQTLGAWPADRFDAQADLVHRGGAETNLFKSRRQFTLNKIEELFCLRAPRLIINSGINVFGVFPEDDHIHFLRMFDWRGNPVEV